MTTLYQPIEGGGIVFVSERKMGDTRIPNYVIDMYMPLVGGDAFSLYNLYCRLERAGQVKGLNMTELGKAIHVSRNTISRLNDVLEAAGMIRMVKPSGREILMHYSTSIVLLDPPETVTTETLSAVYTFLGREISEYTLITSWLVGDSPSISMHSNALDSASERASGGIVDGHASASKIESLIVEEPHINPPPAPPSHKNEKGGSRARAKSSQKTASATQVEKPATPKQSSKKKPTGETVTYGKPVDRWNTATCRAYYDSNKTELDELFAIWTQDKQGFIRMKEVSLVEQRQYIDTHKQMAECGIHLDDYEALERNIRLNPERYWKDGLPVTTILKYTSAYLKARAQARQGEGMTGSESEEIDRTPAPEMTNEDFARIAEYLPKGIDLDYVNHTLFG